jgi:DNA-binding FrmR family transcriptional regulator
MAEGGYKTSQEQLHTRLPRIEGQVPGVRSMVNEERVDELMGALGRMLTL